MLNDKNFKNFFLRSIAIYNLSCIPFFFLASTDTTMTSVQQSQEDLEARIARIKKRNEEIEKKHREAEADRLMAMKENAMVEIKPPKDEDWPREHKYDKIDFTYDLDADALAELEGWSRLVGLAGRCGECIDSVQS